MSSLYSIADFLRDFSNWYYGRGFSELVHIYRNIAYFIKQFFSMDLLVRTLFAPLRRMSEPYSKRFSLSSIFSSLVINSIMRLVGFLARSAFLLLSVLCYICAFGLAIITALLWLLLPAVLITLLLMAANLIYTNYI